MAQHIEIEFKNMLTEDEFQRLSAAFGFEEEDFKEQVNHYFDTNDFQIKAKQAALRTRFKHGEWVLTLKEPAETGLLETEEILSHETARLLMDKQQFPAGIVYNQLSQLGIDPLAVTYFGSLTTWRAEKKSENGLIVLDRSRYLTIEDFELEFEANEFAAGELYFSRLLDMHQIPVRPTKNKVRRFYEQKYKE
ncbi:CYTH domain-containing protein [Bacillus sp. FJAT-42376]|uniref:CYTH domain-containing protein n=1 Tax=Bacillus sp. FJAT-42376 TaxID=2014076 RepID=UPI000F4D93E0|nr:CYTH domain-containing protein [Bacillus sp. FJAT-42376]AZB42380.1 CYTH domain-containing protein [Bacillus sp. FJAT-42376]